MSAVFSPYKGTLSTDENEIRLTEQAQICLIWFCQHEGTLVTREALTQACWGSRNLVVSDATVRQTIFRLRKSLTEAGLGSDTIQTIGKAGYCLTAGAIRLEHDSLATSEEAEQVIPLQPGETPDTHIKPRVWQRMRITWQYMLILSITALIAGGTGYYFRLNQFITDIHYESATSERGRNYFFNTRIESADKSSAIKRTDFWLDREKLPPEQSRYVYINGVLNASIIAMICSGPISDDSSACRTLTIIGDYHP